MTNSNQEPEEIKAEDHDQTSQVIDQDKLKLYIEKLKLEQNLIGGLLFGAAASIIGAIAWAVITVITKYQIGYMAIAVGFLVGYAVRYQGKGIDQIFGISGAILALLGCLLGNYLSIIGFIANQENLGYFQTLMLIDLNLIPEIMSESFQPMDLFFYGLAIYEGYKFSFRTFTEQELADNAGVVKKVTTV